MIDINKYSFFQPFKGYVVLKEIEPEKKSGLIKSGMQESRAMAHVVAVNDKMMVNIKVGDLVIYNENEGQEAYKWGPIKEDGIILIHEEDVICLVEQAEKQ